MDDVERFAGEMHERLVDAGIDEDVATAAVAAWLAAIETWTERMRRLPPPSA